MSDADRERTAYHESGHALVGMLTQGADPVRKISIIPRGQALGVTLSTPEADRYGYERDELIGKIKVALGGRAAEKVVYDELTTGAESDIQQITQIARGMVGRWGMSDVIGPIAVADGRSDGMLLPGQSPTSPETPAAGRRGGAPDRRGGRARHGRCSSSASARAWRRWPAPCWSKETLDQAEAYEIAGVPLPESADEAPDPGVALAQQRVQRPRRGAARPRGRARRTRPSAGRRPARASRRCRSPSRPAR